MRVKSYDHLHFSTKFVVKFLASRYFMRWIGHASEKLGPFEFLENIRCSISSVSICYAPESDIRVKSYDHLHFQHVELWKQGKGYFSKSLGSTSKRHYFEIPVMPIWPGFNEGDENDINFIKKQLLQHLIFKIHGPLFGFSNVFLK